MTDTRRSQQARTSSRRRRAVRRSSRSAAPQTASPNQGTNNTTPGATFAPKDATASTNAPADDHAAASDTASQPADSAQSGTPTFEELGVAAEIVDALAEHGITHTFAIQELTLPLALDGKDLIGQARTGMGKTLAYGVPLLDRIFDDAAIPELDGTPRALVVAPTRELAYQVSDNLTLAAKHLANFNDEHRSLRVTTICGGHPFEKQITQLREGTDCIVGTPGRLLDLCKNRELDLSHVAVLVLDEADEMLDLGFLPDIEKILQQVPEKRQTMLFSATMPAPIMALARTFMNKPVHIRAEGTDDSTTHATTKQVAFKNHKLNKLATLSAILQAHNRGRTIIFTRTKRSAADVADDLAQRGFLVGAVHGDMAQPAREKSLDAFRSKKIEVLVATDVAARGIDVDDVTHVINYQVPDDAMTYVHRIGRTGRAGHTGTAVTLVGWDEVTKWKVIDDELDLNVGELDEWFSTSPELREALNIPDDVDERVGESRPVYGGAKVLSPQRKSAKRASRPRRDDRRQGDPHRRSESRARRSRSGSRSHSRSRSQRRK